MLRKCDSNSYISFGIKRLDLNSGVTFTKKLITISLLQKQPAAQLPKNVPTFCANRSLITAFRRALYRSQS
jgi:hypothetical protein